MKGLASLWPRVIEAALAVWLALASWWLQAPAVLRVHDAAVAVVMLLVTSAAVVAPERRLNLYNVLVGFWLAAFALLWSRFEHPKAAQSELLVGLSLVMFAIIPSRAMGIPVKWRDFYLRHPQTVSEERRAVAARGEATAAADH